MIPSLPAVVRRSLSWREPAEVAAGLQDHQGALALISGGVAAREGVSWVGASPDLVWTETQAGADLFRLLREGADLCGVVGLAAYDAGARAATGRRPQVWPDLILARYPALLRFDHAAQAVTAIGRGETMASAATQADRAVGWLEAAFRPSTPEAPAADFTPEAPPETYAAAVADVIRRIAAGELFQANIARAWGGALAPGRDPFEVFLRLVEARGGAFDAFWRLGDRALVSNSPELFLTHDPQTGRIETRPIKGTRPRRSDARADAAEAGELLASAKDRAENLMIVDLMRNDLARVCEPGTVEVETLFALASLPTVHHLVSTVSGRARSGSTAADVLTAAFPPGSITGAPKHQAMKVIAAHEPPRGPWCGSLFMIDDVGRMTASVLIRTAAFRREGEVWRFRTLAGAGIVADSDPQAELSETDSKISALREALVGNSAGASTPQGV